MSIEIPIELHQQFTLQPAQRIESKPLNSPSTMRLRQQRRAHSQSGSPRKRGDAIYARLHQTGMFALAGHVADGAIQPPLRHPGLHSLWQPGAGEQWIAGRNRHDRRSIHLLGSIDHETKALEEKLQHVGSKESLRRHAVALRKNAQCRLIRLTFKHRSSSNAIDN